MYAILGLCKGLYVRDADIGLNAPSRTLIGEGYIFVLGYALTLTKKKGQISLQSMLKRLAKSNVSSAGNTYLLINSHLQSKVELVLSPIVDHVPEKKCVLPTPKELIKEKFIVALHILNENIKCQKMIMTRWLNLKTEAVRFVVEKINSLSTTAIERVRLEACSAITATEDWECLRTIKQTWLTQSNTLTNHWW